MVPPPFPPISKRKLPRYGPFLTRYRSDLLPGDQDSVSTACNSKGGFGRHGRKVFSIKSSCSLESFSISGKVSAGSSVGSMRSSKSQKKIEDIETFSTQSTTINNDPTAVPAVVAYVIEKEDARESNDRVGRTNDAQRATEESCDGVAVLKDEDLDERCPTELPGSCSSCDENSVDHIEIKAENCVEADKHSSTMPPDSTKSDDNLDMTQSFNELTDETVSNLMEQCLSSVSFAI